MPKDKPRADGFEQVEITEPQSALDETSARTDPPLDAARLEDFDALEVVVDGRIVTSREPDDIPAFEAFAVGDRVHAEARR
jgi:putative intracellular protease/amidase